MKFLVNQQIITKALNTVSKAITSRTTIPILKDIYVEAKNDIVILKATDLNISIETFFNSNIIEEGSLTIPSKLFIEIIRKLPNEQLTIESEENSIIIRTNSSEFKINTHNSDEFPSFGNIENNKRIVIDREILKSMIKKTYFSASTDDSHLNLTGLLFEIEKNSINMVSSDGFRISVSRETMINEIEEKILINAKIFGEILKILMESSSEEDVEIIFGEKDLLFNIDNTKVFLRIMDVGYINYKDILPTDCSTKILIDRKELLNSIERASLMAKEGKNNLIKCNINHEEMIITSRSEDGSVKESIIIDKKGENLEIGFNSKYIIDALKVIEDEEVVIEFKNSLSPCSIKPKNDNAYEYLILPVRIV